MLYTVYARYLIECCYILCFRLILLLLYKIYSSCCWLLPNRKSRTLLIYLTKFYTYVICCIYIYYSLFQLSIHFKMCMFIWRYFQHNFTRFLIPPRFPCSLQSSITLIKPFQYFLYAVLCYVPVPLIEWSHNARIQIYTIIHID